jgi:DNA-directed RNA polymerase alpha subunit
MTLYTTIGRRKMKRLSPEKVSNLKKLLIEATDCEQEYEALERVAKESCQNDSISVEEANATVHEMYLSKLHFMAAQKILTQYSEEMVNELVMDELAKMNKSELRKEAVMPRKEEGRVTYIGKGREIDGQRIWLEATLEDIGFTTRVNNCLKAENVYTLADLMSLTWNQIYLMENLGLKSRKEIKERLLYWGLKIPEGWPHRHNNRM